MRSLAFPLALLACGVLGCGPWQPSKGTTEPSKTRPSPGYGVEALREGAYHLRLASESLAGALTALRDAEPRVRAGLRSGIADAADRVDAAGEGISEFVEPPTEERAVADRGAAITSHRERAHRAASDALEAAEEALGIVESLVEEATGEDLLTLEAPMRALRAATVDLRTAIEALRSRK